jgi:hypothetical protein
VGGKTMLASAIVLVPFLLAAAATQEPAGSSQLTTGPAKDEKRPSSDKLQLPEGAILVPYEVMVNGSRKVLPYLLVPPEVFKKMEDRIKELERRLNPDKATPYHCKLAGRVETDFAILQAELRFKTEQPQAQVILGFKGAVLSADPDLDGQLPILTYGAEDGYVAQVEKAGDHRLTLQLKVAVAVQRGARPAGTERGFELGLPGAAHTILTLELPKAVKEISCNDNVEKAPGGKTGEIGLSLARSLKVAWREPASVPGAAAPLTAKWQITVTLQETEARTTALLKLDDPRAATRVWRIGAPAGSEVKVLAAAGAVYESAPVDTNGTFLIKGPPTDHLEIQVSQRQSRPFSRLPVGPFFLAGAPRQEGVIEIKAAPDVLHGNRLIYHRQGSILQQEVKAAGAGDVLARFQFWTGPEAGKPGAPRRAPLDVELKPVAAQVETTVEHLLRLRPAEGGAGWQVAAETRIHATPLHNAADFLEVQLPAARPPALPVLAVLAGSGQVGFPQRLLDTAFPLSMDRFWPIQVPQDWQCEGPAASKDLQPAPGQRKVRIHLSRPQLEKFTVVLKASQPYLLPGDLRQARLELPRPLPALDGGGTIKVETEEGLELLVPEESGPAAAPDPHQVITTSARAPIFADLAWRPYRPEVVVQIRADVALQHRWGLVRQEIQVPGPPASKTNGPGRVLRLQIREGVEKLKVVQGGKLFPGDRSARRARALVTGGPLVLEYEFALPARAGKDPRQADKATEAAQESRTFSVPLLWPEDATRANIKVRVWCEPGTLAVLPDLPLGSEPWKEQAIEIVRDRDSLPALVLLCESLGAPLTLRLLGAPLAPLAGVIADRALLQVGVAEDGSRHFRARFRLSKLDVGHLDIEFPVALARLLPRPQILLDGKMPAWRPLAGSDHVARVQINPALYSHAVILEIAYALPADYPEPDGILRTTLPPPLLRGDDVFVGRVRWQVTLPASQVALPPAHHALAEERWARRGWLLGPEPAVSARELEQWLTGNDSSEEAAPASLVFWAASLESVTVIHLPQQAWLLVCSGCLLLVGLALIAVPLSRTAFGLVVGGLCLGLVAAGFCWPAVVPAVVYGCEPGAVVLALLLGVQWLLHRRYRRQVVFMPGFTRAKPSSALARGSSASQHRPREVSTVDAPPAASGSVSQANGPAKEVAP